MKKKNNRRKSIILVLGVVLSMGLISYQLREKPSKAATTEAQVVPEKETTNQNNTSFVLKKGDLELITVENTDKSIQWPISGRVVPKNTTQLFSEVQGKVLNRGFKLKEGIAFQPGQVLVALDDKEFRLQLEAQRSNFLNLLTGMMPDLKADYPNNYESWLNYIKNYKIGYYLSPLPPTLSDGEKYFVTANQVYSTYYSIKASEERLEKYRILAPYGGLVTAANIDKGSLVSPGQMLGTIINNQHYELEAAAGLEVVSKLKVGDKIIFTNNEIEGKWVGTVLRINDIVDSKTQNIPIYFEIKGKNIKAGMYLEGTFTGKAYSDVFTIPSEVLTRDDKVLLLSENTILSKSIQPVEFLQDSIIVRGLSDQDMVIANQFEVPVEGLKLTL